LNPLQDYSGSGKPCTQSNFDQFFQTAQNFLEGASFVDMYAMFGKVSTKTNEIESLKRFAGMFRPDELPNNVDQVNSLITCSGSDLSKCKPNSVGSRYLNP
jgi:hypothetical protein